VIEEREIPLLLSEDDDRFCLRKSTIPGAGKGVFAKRSLPQGESLRVAGVLVPADSISDRCTHFADKHKFRVGELLLIPFGYGGIVNHSIKPNMEKVIEENRVYLRAARPIRKGEEILFCYSEYAQVRHRLKKI